MAFKIRPTIEEVRYPKVNTFADLPSASAYTDKIYIVLTATGVWGVNRKRTGMWRSDGVDWNRLGVAPTAEELGAIVGDAPENMKAVRKIYYDPIEEKIAIEKEA